MYALTRPDPKPILSEKFEQLKAPDENAFLFCIILNGLLYCKRLKDLNVAILN